MLSKTKWEFSYSVIEKQEAELYLIDDSPHETEQLGLNKPVGACHMKAGDKKFSLQESALASV